jgi:type IV pilus assembly protein PilM
MIKNLKISKEILNFQKDLKRAKNEIKKLSKKKRKAKEKLFRLSRANLEAKKKELLRIKEKIKKDIEKIEEKEKEIKLEKERIEEEEKREKDLFKKRVIEKERWEVESRERQLERVKWGFEDKLKKTDREVKKINQKLEKESQLKAELKEIERAIKETEAKIETLEEKIQEKKKIEKEFERAWKEFLAGNISSALEKLEKIQKELSKKTEGEKRTEKRASLPTETGKEKKEFFEPLEHYQKGQISAALDTLEKLLEKIKKEEPSFEKERESKPEEPAEKEGPPVVVIKEKGASKEEILEEFKKKLEEEREKLIEEEREKLKNLRDELEERQKEILKATLEGRKSILEEEKLRALQEELIKKELEIEGRYRERLRAQKEKLERKKEELLRAEKSLPLAGLTEEERRKREEIIKSLREKIEEERRRIENKELAEEREREFVKERRLKILENVFEQALSFYNEKEFEKAKRVFSIVKNQIEQGKKLGIFVNLNSIPIYTKSAYFIKKIDEEAKKTQQEITRPKSKKLKFKKTEKKPFFSRQRFLRSLREVFFPLPIVGLDISDYSLELLHLNKKGGVVAFSRQVLKPGVLVDGKVKNPRFFSESLTRLLKIAGFPPFQPKKGAVVKAVISLPSSAVYTLVFRLKSHRDLFREVKEKLEETFPFSLEEIYWDYLVCGKDSFGRIKIVCIAAQRDVVDALVYSLRANGIEPVALDVGMLAIERSLSPQLPSKEKFGILDIGAYITTFDIFDEKGFVEFSTSIPYAGYSFQIELANFLKVPIEKAERMMIEQGFQKSPVKEILEKEIKKIVDEIKEATRHYQEVLKGEIKKIILTGGSSSLPGIVSVFKKFLPAIEVEVGNPFLKIKTKGTFSPKESFLFVGALGLALRAVSKNPIREGINLLPEELKRKEREARFALLKKKLLLIKIILGVLVGLLLALGLYFIFR